MGRVPGFVKWVVSPTLAALLGYGVVGPRLAGHQRIVKAVQEGVSKVMPEARFGMPAEKLPVESPSREASKPVPPPPEVSVTAKPVDEVPAEEPKPRRPRRKRHRAAPTDEAPPETTSRPDRTGPDPASTP